MPSWSSDTILSHGITIHYYRTGGEKPPIVLAHGISDDGLCWAPVAEALADQYDVVMVDARGHGKSDAPEDGYTLRNLGTELSGVITGLGLHKPVILGHSMGAITALVLASLFPDQPAAILLEDPPPFWSAARLTPEVEEARRGLMRWLTSIKRKTCAELQAEVREQNPHWSEAEIAPWVDSKQRVSPLVTQLVIPEDLETLDFPTLVTRIRCPALLISADADRGAAAHPTDIALLKTLIPHLQVVHIADAGHSIRRDQFIRYMDVVQQALAAQHSP